VRAATGWERGFWERGYKASDQNDSPRRAGPERGGKAAGENTPPRRKRKIDPKPPPRRSACYGWRASGVVVVDDSGRAPKPLARPPHAPTAGIFHQPAAKPVKAGICRQVQAIPAKL
jgi:hypothetical protein